MVNKRLMFRAACYLLLIKGNKILLLRRFNTGWEDGKYTLISGHLEKSETVKQAMVREAKEEAGINLDTKDLRVVHTMHRKSNDDLEYIDFFLVARKWQGQPKIAEPEKCDEIRWFALNNLPGSTLLHIKLAIRSYANKVSFSELGF